MSRTIQSTKIIYQCYEMALKSYPAINLPIYEYEKEGFASVANSGSSSVIRYLGCYSLRGSLLCIDGDACTTFNILLEFGQINFERYYTDPTVLPPVVAIDIVRFWESMLKIAHALHTINRFRNIRNGSAGVRWVMSLIQPCPD